MTNRPRTASAVNLKLRLPPDLHNKLAVLAERNAGSLNSEIVCDCGHGAARPYTDPPYTIT